MCVCLCVELDMKWCSIRPVEPALHCDHVTRKIKSGQQNRCQSRRVPGIGLETGEKTKAALGWPLTMSRQACRVHHMRWVRPGGVQLVNQSGALVFFNISHTVHRGAEAPSPEHWEPSGVANKSRTTVRNSLSSVELPGGFWGHGLTLLSIYATLAWSAAGARCPAQPQLEYYWWFTALTKHHHHSSYMWSVVLRMFQRFSCFFFNWTWNGIKQWTEYSNQIPIKSAKKCQFF